MPTPTPTFKVGDVVEIAGRRAKLLSGLGYSGAWAVSWIDSNGTGPYRDAILFLERFPDIKIITPEPMCSVEFAKAIARAVVKECVPEELSEATIKAGWNLCREEMLANAKEMLGEEV